MMLCLRKDHELDYKHRCLQHVRTHFYDHLQKTRLIYLDINEIIMSASLLTEQAWEKVGRATNTTPPRSLATPHALLDELQFQARCRCRASSSLSCCSRRRCLATAQQQYEANAQGDCYTDNGRSIILSVGRPIRWKKKSGARTRCHVALPRVSVTLQLTPAGVDL
uniref:Uncharacterized protein n=1 Tax=Oryza rufipogon TaxID=4529 RepID=A0A0E0Q0B8_ORYRU